MPQFERIVELVAETAMLANYEYDRHLSDADRPGQPVAELRLYVPAERLAEAGGGFARGVAFGNATLFARDLANARADQLTPAALEAIAQALADDPACGGRLQLTVVPATAEDGLPLLAAVGQAAAAEPGKRPRLIVLEWAGAGSADGDTPAVGLVGKGITFDTGGLNLKPTGAIEQVRLTGSMIVYALNESVWSDRCACNASDRCTWIWVGPRRCWPPYAWPAVRRHCSPCAASWPCWRWQRMRSDRRPCIHTRSVDLRDRLSVRRPVGYQYHRSRDAGFGSEPRAGPGGGRRDLRGGGEHRRRGPPRARRRAALVTAAAGGEPPVSAD